MAINDTRLEFIENHAWTAAEYPSGSEARREFLAFIDAELDELRAEGLEDEELDDIIEACSQAFNERRVQVLDADPAWYLTRLWRDIRTLPDWPGATEPKTTRA